MQDASYRRHLAFCLWSFASGRRKPFRLTKAVRPSPVDSQIVKCIKMAKRELVQCASVSRRLWSGLLPQGGESRSALPRRGTKSHLMLRSSRQVLLVVDEERQRRLLTNGSEDHSPGVLRLLWSAAESRRTCLRANLIRRPVPQGHGLAPCVMVFPLQVLSPFTFFEYGSRLAPMLGKTRSRLTTLYKKWGTARRPVAFDNADGPIWNVGEKGSFCRPKKFLEVARPMVPFFLGVLKMKLRYVTFYETSCPHCSQKNPFLSNGGI